MPGGAAAHHCVVGRTLGDRAVCAARQASSRPASASSTEREDRGGKERGVDGAGASDGERADRNAGRHLDDGERLSWPAKRLGFDRHAEHRQRRHRGGHAGEMRRAAGAGDDDLEAGAPWRPWRSDRAGPACGGPRRSGPHGRCRARQRLGGVRIVAQSDWLPMTMATGGVGSIMTRLFRSARLCEARDHSAGAVAPQQGAPVHPPAHAMMSGRSRSSSTRDPVLEERASASSAAECEWCRRRPIRTIRRSRRRGRDAPGAIRPARADCLLFLRVKAPAARNHRPLPLLSRLSSDGFREAPEPIAHGDPAGINHFAPDG